MSTTSFSRISSKRAIRTGTVGPYVLSRRRRWTRLSPSERSDAPTPTSLDRRMTKRSPVIGRFRVSMPNWDQRADGSVKLSVADALKWDQNSYHPRVGGERDHGGRIARHADKRRLGRLRPRAFPWAAWRRSDRLSRRVRALPSAAGPAQAWESC